MQAVEAQPPGADGGPQGVLEGPRSEDLRELVIHHQGSFSGSSQSVRGKPSITHARGGDKRDEEVYFTTTANRVS
ncbi:hypothetical protein GCM10009530_02090 [Microbispora corallina]